MKNFLWSLLVLAGAARVWAGPVSEHGALHVDGHRIVGADGRAVSLAGNSFFWSQWMGRFYNAGTVDWLRSDWKSGVIRAAMGVEEGGYLAHPETETAHVSALVDAAIAADIYVIIDWHDHRANQHTEQAVAFFQEMARKYGRHPNIMYEIFNEPKGDVTWSGDVKPYAEKVIAAIRAIDPANLIIVGSPHWSQDVDVAAADPIAARNIAYSLHFYAGTHRQWLRDKALVALNKNLPVFVTEWGTCNADGNGPVDRAETALWMAFMREWQLSHCNWSVSDKKESASILVAGASSTGHWAENELTESGRLVREWTRAWAENPPGPGK
jgi:endoglucanase